MEENSSVDATKLKQIVENIEYLEDHKREIMDQINAIYKEAKAYGFESSIIRKIISLRKKDMNKLKREESLMESYKISLGMI